MAMIYNHLSSNFPFDPTMDEGIRVAIRVRPPNQRETSSGQEAVLRCIQNNSIQLKDGQVRQRHSGTEFT
jgi:hypothetical protein